MSQEMNIESGMVFFCDGEIVNHKIGIFYSGHDYNWNQKITNILCQNMIISIS